MNIDKKRQQSTAMNYLSQYEKLNIRLVAATKMKEKIN